MKKVILFLLIFLLIPDKTFTDNNLKKNNSTSCNVETNESYIKSINKVKIKHIEVDVHNFRKWTENSIRILINKSRYTPDKFKKRYDSTITITYENNIECILKARVRHSGDEKDHIALQGNGIIQSLDVHLESGNIRGITKFKLLRPDTRGVLEDEILVTEILRSFGYLAPRTLKADVRINNSYSKMILQEKAAKELLEYNNRREAPILEGDERFFWKRIEKIPDNQLSNWSIGVVPLLNKSAKHMLVKQVNSQIIKKSEGHKNMSFEAISKLNLIFLYYSNKFQNETNNYHYFDYDLDNTLLGLLNSKNIKKLDVYNLFAEATNGHHGLSPNNRKFYWNAIENYFEPINYDSNSNINSFLPLTNKAYRLPISEEFYDAFNVLETLLIEIDIESLKENINSSGIKTDKEYLNKKINKILKNLKAVKRNYLQIDQNIIEENKYEPLDDVFSTYNKNITDLNLDLYLVKHNKYEDNMKKCQIDLKNCEDFNVSEFNLPSLLEGELKMANKAHQYIGNNLDIKKIQYYGNYKNLKLNDTNIFYQNGIEINISQDKKLIIINQNKPEAKLYLIGGEIENVKIEFNGFNETDILNQTNRKKFLKIDSSDIKGLTGCLSFINMKVTNISIFSNFSKCEDSVNFINTNGFIDKIQIGNSSSDGLDIDFSNLLINDISINSAGNDCVDLSSGIYEAKTLSLKDCGDKGLSVGEKSFLKLKSIDIKNAKTGVASKDSSITKIVSANLDYTDVCFSAYNKKQEFNGGLIKIIDMKCNNYNELTVVDSKSKILQNDTILKNSNTNISKKIKTDKTT